MRVEIVMESYKVDLVLCRSLSTRAWCFSRLRAVECWRLALHPSALRINFNRMFMGFSKLVRHQGFGPSRHSMARE